MMMPYRVFFKPVCKIILMVLILGLLHETKKKYSIAINEKQSVDLSKFVQHQEGAYVSALV